MHSRVLGKAQGLEASPICLGGFVCQACRGSVIARRRITRPAPFGLFAGVVRVPAGIFISEGTNDNRARGDFPMSILISEQDFAERDTMHRIARILASVFRCGS